MASRHAPHALSKRGERALRRYIRIARDEGAKGVTLLSDGSVALLFPHPSSAHAQGECARNQARDDAVPHACEAMAGAATHPSRRQTSAAAGHSQQRRGAGRSEHPGGHPQEVERTRQGQPEKGTAHPREAERVAHGYPPGLSAPAAAENSRQRRSQARAKKHYAKLKAEQDAVLPEQDSASSRPPGLQPLE